MGSRKEFLLTLHKKKNERRVTAFVDTKRKMAKENTKFRQEQKESARKMYNSMASVPILPNYSYRLPTLEETMRAAADYSDEDGEEEEEEEDLPEDERENIVTADGELDEEALDRQERKRMARKAKSMEEKRNQTVFFPMAGGGEEGAANKKGGKKASSSTSVMDNSGVVVSVEPLFGRRAAPVEETVAEDGKKLNRKQMSMLGSQRLVDSIAEKSSLPLEVIKELAKIREETKGPARTEPRLRMMKELEKIRKIRKHSRKGHGKKSNSGKGKR
eukprot:GDKK01076090.1.p1 GENE.GDKK01076090.1~~GDKK01076090.1.p1  ORF type:complete len:274 (-),score=73.26 GDKK01076090.1:79-900(-)